METAKKVIRYTIVAAMLCLVAAIIVRIWIGENKNVLKDVYPSDAVIAAYTANPDMRISMQEKIGLPIDNDGAFAATDIVWIPEAKQFQVTVRFNDSTVKYARQKDAGLDGVEPAEMFAYALTDGTVTFPGVVCETQKKYIYTYQRVIFSDITLDQLKQLMLTPRLAKEDVEASSYASFSIAYEDSLLEVTERPLTKREIRRIEERKNDTHA